MYNTDDERKKLASAMMTFLRHLMDAGFTREEALQIVIAFVQGKSSVSSF